MSAIWDNEEVKEKVLMLSPDLQETFLRAVDALHYRESDFMLAFLQESRDELNDTHREIAREQEVLRDTSDLLASKRMYGDPDEWEDNQNEMNAVDNYLRRRNQGDALGILSFEDEQKAKKKAKRREKEKERRSKSGRHSASDRLSGSFSMLDEISEGKTKKKKDKKHRDKKLVTSAWNDEHEVSGVILESGDKPRTEDKEKNKEEDEVKEKDKEKNKEKKKKNKKEKKERRSSQSDIIGSSLLEKPIKSMELLEKPMKSMEREKTLDDIQRETTNTDLIEQETNAIMKEFLGRESSNVDQKNQFEEAMKKKLAQKKNKHAAEADELLHQQMAADKAINDAKADYEAKMMAKLKAKRERSNMSRGNTDLVSADPAVSADPDPNPAAEDQTDKPKKEKKKKKHKEKDNERADGEDEEIKAKKEKKEKKKKKKKDKDNDKDSHED